MQVTQDPGECKLTVTALPHANCGEAPLPPCQVDWVSPAPGYARGRTATVFFCDWEGCTSVWPHPNPAQTWAIISEPPSYYCTFAPELLHACPLFRSPFRRVHRRPCLPACMHACLPACLPACLLLPSSPVLRPISDLHVLLYRRHAERGRPADSVAPSLWNGLRDRRELDSWRWAGAGATDATKATEG
jgi:hypothetical protein